MKSWRQARVLALMLALFVSACGGPEALLDIGHKEVPTNIILGGKKDDAPPPLIPIAPTALELAAPSFLGPVPSPDTAPLPSPRPKVACPKANPLEGPEDVAGNAISLPPAAGAYPFRNEGSFDVGGPNASRGVYPADSTRQVTNVRKQAATPLTPLEYSFDVVAELGGTITATTYRLVPSGPAGGSFDITRIVTTPPQGATTTFTPNPPISLLTFPIEPGQSVTRVAADPQSGVTIQYTRTVGQKVRVDACGVPLDAHAVNFSGVIANAGGSAVNISADYAIAPQFGGLFVEDRVEISGSEGGAPVTRSNKATITVRPALAAEPSQ